MAPLQPKNYHTEGGNKWVVGGELVVEPGANVTGLDSGGGVELASTAPAALAASAAVGVGETAARADHVHAYPAQLATARQFSLTGDVTATAVSFTGAANVALSTAIGAGVIVNADINASAAIALSKLANVAAGTDGLEAGTLQATLQALATRIAALETP